MQSLLLKQLLFSTLEHIYSKMMGSTDSPYHHDGWGGLKNESLNAQIGFREGLDNWIYLP